MTATSLFDCEQVGQVLVIKLQEETTGFIEADIVAEAQELLERLKRLQLDRVLVDFGNVDYFGSLVLEAVQGVWKGVQPEGRVAICHLSQVGLEVLQISKFDTVWEVFSSREDALASLQSE